MNNVKLTDNELILIMTALNLTIESIEKYKKTNTLDIITITTYNESKKLHDKLKISYF